MRARPAVSRTPPPLRRQTDRVERRQLPRPNCGVGSCWEYRPRRDDVLGYTAEPNSPAAQAIQILGSWTAAERTATNNPSSAEHGRTIRAPE